MVNDELPADRAHRIADAVESIERLVTQLRDHQDLSHEEYTDPAEQDRRDAIERKFVKLTEATVDIVTELCKQEVEKLPERRKPRIDALVAEGVVDSSLGERLKTALGFRDVLAHTYGPIVNDDIVYDALQNDLERYVEFVEAVDRYLQEDT
jgi:uncharacterized protein YutE (UPF0331/DUF86 family)